MSARFGFAPQPTSRFSVLGVGANDAAGGRTIAVLESAGHHVSRFQTATGWQAIVVPNLGSGIATIAESQIGRRASRRRTGGRSPIACAIHSGSTTVEACAGAVNAAKATGPDLASLSTEEAYTR